MSVCVHMSMHVCHLACVHVHVCASCVRVHVCAPSNHRCHQQETEDAPPLASRPPKYSHIRHQKKKRTFLPRMASMRRGRSATCVTSPPPPPASPGCAAGGRPPLDCCCLFPRGCVRETEGWGEGEREKREGEGGEAGTCTFTHTWMLARVRKRSCHRLLTPTPTHVL